MREEANKQKVEKKYIQRGFQWNIVYMQVKIVFSNQYYGHNILGSNIALNHNTET